MSGKEPKDAVAMCTSATKRRLFVCEASATMPLRTQTFTYTHTVLSYCRFRSGMSWANGRNGSFMDAAEDEGLRLKIRLIYLILCKRTKSLPGCLMRF